MSPRFKAKKVYGKSKILSCPFCSRTATQKNGQGLDVCFRHTKEFLNDVKCLCSGLLEIRQGNYGAYFHCHGCGNLSLKRGMEIREMLQQRALSRQERRPVLETGVGGVGSAESHGKEIAAVPKAVAPKETTISSRDVKYFD